jgi:hypothetical protein
VSQPVFRSVHALGPSHHAIHLLLVTPQQRDVVSHHQMTSVLQFAFISLLKRTLGVGEAVGEEIAGRKIGIAKDNVGTGRDTSPGYLDRSFKSACTLGGEAA